MPADLGTEIEKAYQDLRGIDSELSTLSGGRGTIVDRTTRRVINIGSSGQGLSVGIENTSGAIGDRLTRRRVTESNYDDNRSGERRVQEVGSRRRIVVSTDNNGDSGRKRSYNDADNYQPPLKRTLQSSVVMPTIETKSREAAVTEMKKSEKTGDAVRNRRMFSNLLVGTLKQFQKEEKSGQIRIQAQMDKQRAVEKRLEMTDKENKNKIYKEKEELLRSRREKEEQILRLKRKKAIVQYAEDKQKHLRRLQCFIQTQTKPPIFFLPAKHTLRTLELLKDSAKKVETLIELRQQELERELRRDEGNSSDDEPERAGGLKSAVVTVPRKSSDGNNRRGSHDESAKAKKEVLSEDDEESKVNGKAASDKSQPTANEEGEEEKKNRREVEEVEDVEIEVGA